MIKARSKVKINKTMVKKLDKAAITALEKTAEALHAEIVNAQVIPFDNGTLQNENTFVDYSKSQRGRVSIVTQGPQARRLYYHPEYNYQKTNNPKAGGQWLDLWISGSEKEFYEETFAEFYRKEIGGM